jgi:hypothetical protein
MLDSMTDGLLEQVEQKLLKLHDDFDQELK